METIKNKDLDLSQAIVIDAHLLKTYRACEQKFNYFEIQHIVGKHRKAAPSFGIALHEGIAAYREAKKASMMFFDAMKTGAKALGDAYRKHMPQEAQQENFPDERRTLVNALRLFQGYCHHYEPMGYKNHYIEVPFAMYLGTIEVAGVKKEVVYVGIIDAVLELHNTIGVNDIKSTGWTINESWLEGFRMDQGLLGYVVAARELLGIDTHHAMVHAIWVQKEAKDPKKAKPIDDYFRTKEIYWDDDQINEWHLNTLRTVERIERAKLEDKWIMDYGQNCGAFGGCDYRPLCSATPKIRQRLVDLDYMKAIWSPLEDERLQKLDPDYL